MFSLLDLSNHTWYAQDLIIKDERTGEEMPFVNYKLQSKDMTDLTNRWVSSIGVYDGRLIVNII